MQQYTYTDIDLEMNTKRNGDIQKFTSVDAIKSSISNIISTMKGERRMLPEFASNLWQLLFEPMDEITAQSIGEEFVEVIERWDERVIIKNVHVSPNYEMQKYETLISFNLKNSENVEEISIILERT